MSKLRTDYIPDDPIALDAKYQIGAADRRKIDDQVLDLQQFMVDAVMSGATCSYFTLSQSSAPLVPGMAFCTSQGGPPGRLVTKAVAAALAVSGAAIGVAMTAVAPGTTFRGLMSGVIPPDVSSLGDGDAADVRINATTALLERVDSPSDGDYLIGVADSQGTVTLRGAPGTPGARGVDGTPGANGTNGANGAPGLAGRGLAPIRAVQTAVMTGWTYSAGTWTGPVGALPSPWTLFDYIATPTLLDAGYEVYGGNGTLGSAQIGNGVFVPTSLGSVSTSPTLVRRADMNTSAQMNQGATYLVQDGASPGGAHKGELRGLLTTGTIVLDTTALMFDKTTPKSGLLVDAMGWPYNVRSQFAAGSDYAAAINQALYDAHQIGIAASPKIPVRVRGGGLGQVFQSDPLYIWDYSGLEDVCLNGTGQQGSPQIFIDKSAAILTGPVVDTGGSYSLQMWHPTDSTQDECLWLSYTTIDVIRKATTGTLGYKCAFTFRIGGATVLASDGHIGSTRGHIESSGDATVCEYYYLVGSTGKVNAQVRAISPGAVYGFGTSPPAVSILAGSIPDGVLFEIQCDHIGALALGSGATFRYRCNHGDWIEIGKTIAASVALTGAMTGVTLGFAAATYTGPATSVAFAARNNFWQNWTLYTLVSNTVCALATNYTAECILDSSTGVITLSVSTGGVLDASPATATAHVGDYVQRIGPFEFTTWGAPGNTNFGSGVDTATAKVYLGSIYYSCTPRAATGATTLTRVNDVNSTLFVRFGTANEKKDPSGAVRGWFANTAYNGASGNSAVMHVRTTSATGFGIWSRLKNISRVSGNKRPGIWCTTGITDHAFDDIVLSDGPLPYTIFGPSFYGTQRNIRAASKIGWPGFFIVNGEAVLSGTWVEEGNGPLVLVQVAGQIENMWLSPPPSGTIYQHAFAVMIQVAGSLDAHLTIDDEATPGIMGAGLILSGNANQPLRLFGSANFSSQRYTPIHWSQSSGASGILEYGIATGVNINARSCISIRNALAGPVKIIRDSVFGAAGTVPPYCDVPGYVAPNGGAVPIQELTGANQTLTIPVSQPKTRVHLTAGGTTGVLTLAPSYEGHEVRVMVEAQSGAYSVLNGGNAGGTLGTASSVVGLYQTYIWKSTGFGTGNWIQG